MGEGVGVWGEALEIRWPGKASESVTFELRPHRQEGADEAAYFSIMSLLYQAGQKIEGK